MLKIALTLILMSSQFCLASDFVRCSIEQTVISTDDVCLEWEMNHDDLECSKWGTGLTPKSVKIAKLEQASEFKNNATEIGGRDDESETSYFASFSSDGYIVKLNFKEQTSRTIFWNKNFKFSNHDQLLFTIIPQKTTSLELGDVSEIRLSCVGEFK